MTGDYRVQFPRKADKPFETKHSYQAFTVAGEVRGAKVIDNRTGEEVPIPPRFKQ